jgi:hypothetical protein
MNGQDIWNRYDDFTGKFPELVKEEIVFEGVFITVARVTLGDLNPIIGEGISKRSGCVVPDEPNGLGREIAMGRAQKAAALKLASKKRWIKIHDDMMA